MDFQELITHYRLHLFSEDGIALRKITPSYYDQESGREENIHEHTLLFVKEGEMTIRVMGNTLKLTKNCYIDIIENELPWTQVSISPDIQAYQVILSQDFLFNLGNDNKPPVPASYILEKRTNPVFQVEAECADNLVRCLDEIAHTLQDTQNRFRKELLLNRTRTFFMEMGNLLYQAKDKGKMTENNRKRCLFMQFVHMLPDYVKKEHSVNFYAAQLCVTPQYLGRIVQEYSGRTVYQWISETLVRNIIRLLTDTDMSIQEIAEELHFSDQAVLSKLFKRYQGVSPREYRNRHR